MNFDASRAIRCPCRRQKPPPFMRPAPADSVPEARETFAGGETTGQARPIPHNIRRALEGREKGTRGLACKIATGHSPPSRAPAGAHPGFGGGGAVRFRWFPVAPRPSPPTNLFRASGSVMSNNDQRINRTNHSNSTVPYNSELLLLYANKQGHFSFVRKYRMSVFHPFHHREKHHHHGAWLGASKRATSGVWSSQATSSGVTTAW